MQNRAQVLDERLASRVGARGSFWRPIASHNDVRARQRELRHALGVLGKELRVAIKNGFVRIVEHSADDTRKKNSFAPDDDVPFETADPISKLFDVMMPAPFTVAD